MAAGGGVCCASHHSLLILLEHYSKLGQFVSGTSNISTSTGTPEWVKNVSPKHLFISSSKIEPYFFGSPCNCTIHQSVIAYNCIISNTPWSNKKQDTKFLSITSPNNDRFSKFFHYYTQQEICNKGIITDPTTP